MTISPRSPWILLLTALVLAVLIDILFFGVRGLGLNFALLQLLFVGACVGLSCVTGRRLTRADWVAAGFGCAFAVTVCLWSSSYGIVFAILGWLASNILFGIGLVRPVEGMRHPLSYLVAAAMAFGTWIMGLEGLSKLKIHRVKAPNAAVLRGVGFSLVALVVFGILFATADAAFGTGLQNIISTIGGWIGENSIGHIIWIIFFTLAFFALFFKAFGGNEAPKVHVLPERPSSTVTESTIVLAAVNVLFFIFLIVQAVYLFGGEATLHSIGLTYAQYARQGFGQLIAVAILVILLTLYLRHFHGRHGQMRLRALGVVLYIQTLVVAFSAALRLGLYVQAYGWTPSRLFGFWLIGLVVVLIVLCVIHVMLGLDQARLLRQMCVVTACAGLIFIVAQTDALAIQLNLSAGRNITFEDVRGLGDDAIPAIRSAIESGRVKDGADVYHLSADACANGVEDSWNASAIGTNDEIDLPVLAIKYDQWQAWNLARMSRARCENVAEVID